MDTDAQHELKQRIFSLTWQSLKAEAEALQEGAPPDASQPALKRFYSPHTLECVREAIVRACREAEADSELSEFLSTRWLQQFAPRPI